MSDLPGGDAVHEVVAAVLAATPTIDPVHGKTVTDFHGNLYDAEPIAARQAAAVLRWAADRIQHPNSHAEVNCAVENLRTQADRIDPPEETDGQR